jgi:4-hydroxy-4-methyl-2-oxoglutarate aldolase
MSSPHEVLVRNSIVRNDPELVELVRGTPTGFVVDAQRRSGAVDFRIKPVTANSSFTGTALTVRCRPWDNLAAHVALEHVRPGDVLMITTGGFEGASVIGEKYVGMARNQGAVAIVVDGMARDISNCDKIGIPVFARGIIANSSFKNGPGEVGLPISLGGVAVDAGDLVVGDKDGVVVVPRQFASIVATKVRSIVERETAMFAAISAGGSKPDAMSIISKEAAIRFVE